MINIERVGCWPGAVSGWIDDIGLRWDVSLD
jgi:hypothetical protein